MTGAFSGPCGRMRLVETDASGTCALLASHCWSAASVSASGSAMFESGAGSGKTFSRGEGGLSQSRGSSWTAISTPASSHHASALLASATPIDSTSPPTSPSSPPLTVRSRNGQGRRVELCSRRDERTMGQRESMAYDVVIVGAGPAGLSAAIRLKQVANAAGRELSVCILEKGSEIGAHILSGAVIDPIALNELIPDWKERGAPLTVPVTENHHWVLTKSGKWGIPELLTPPFMHNMGTYTLSLGNLCRWLAGQAEELGVEIFPGFPAAEILFHDDGSVKGVATGDMGVARDGSHRPDYQPGIELHARYTFFAEGARGHLTKRLSEIFNLREKSGPQVFGIGIKELWDVPPDKHKPGRVIHTQGWPLEDAWGGGFLYHQEAGQVALGFVVSLDYRNAY